MVRADSLIRVASAAHVLAALLEASYTYETINEKRWELGDGGRSGNCEWCVDASDMGWIPDEDVYDTPMGDADGPPGHPNCFLAGTLVSAVGPIAAVAERVYEGEILVLRISGVQDLACTPNHPIFTRRGWLPACALKVGDRLLKCPRPSALISRFDPNHNHIESSIEKIGDALMMERGMMRRRMPVAAEAFHGDVRFDSKVNIVRAHRTFAGNRANRDKFVVDADLRGGHRSWPLFMREGSFKHFVQRANHAADGVLGRLCLSCLLFFSQSGLMQDAGFLDGSLPQSDSIPFDRNSAPGYADPLRYGGGALASHVRFVELREINVRVFRGQVYNLQTESGFYLANSIVAHNCTCTLAYRERRYRVAA